MPGAAMPFRAALTPGAGDPQRALTWHRGHSALKKIQEKVLITSLQTPYLTYPWICALYHGEEQEHE